MKTNHYLILLFLPLVLTACGRDDFGYIKNETGKTVKINGTRDSIQNWEFDKIKATGNGINIQASGKDILKLVKKKKHFFSQKEYSLVLK